jgi:prepilin-type N-terminal cleavage/methylation domain-containing protein
MQSPSVRRPAAGFTLIELLIVIAILGLLAAVLLPNIVGMGKAAKEDATGATLLQISVGCENFTRKHGYFPPDDLKNPENPGKAVWKPDNGQNTGIESLVCFLSQGRADGEDFTSLGDKLTNTDKDDHGVDLPLLKTRERLEIADAWGTPLAYFGKFGLDKQQTVAIAEGESLFAKAKKGPDGRVFGDGKYQVLSAGADLIFGTDDDIVWPKN